MPKTQFVERLLKGDKVVKISHIHVSISPEVQAKLPDGRLEKIEEIEDLTGEKVLAILWSYIHPQVPGKRRRSYFNLETGKFICEVISSSV